MEAILLVAHSFPKENEIDELSEIIRSIKEKKGYEIVEAAYFQSDQPDISEGVLACVKQGATKLYVIPYLFTKGNLEAKALQIAREEGENFRGLSVVSLEAIGKDSELANVFKDLKSKERDSLQAELKDEKDETQVYEGKQGESS